MFRSRIIARVDIKQRDAIKSIKFEGVKKVGKANDLLRKYYADGADELMLIDAVASLYRRKPDYGFISETLTNVFVPVTYGGGLHTPRDLEDAFKAGADKVAINTAAVRDRDFVRHAVRTYGSQCVVGSVVAIKTAENFWEVRTDNAREAHRMNAVTWAKELEDLGVGEIMISSVDKEGMKKGFELELANQVAEALSVPVIVYGGAGSSAHIQELFKIKGVNAACISSVLHYGIETIQEIKSKVFA